VLRRVVERGGGTSLRKLVDNSILLAEDVSLTTRFDTVVYIAVVRLGDAMEECFDWELPWNDRFLCGENVPRPEN